MATLRETLGKMDTLLDAWNSIKKRSFSKGLEEENIESFKNNLDENIRTISRAIIANKYKFGRLKAVTIKKKDGSLRPLQIQEVRDRVVTKALATIVENNISKKLNLCNEASYGYLKNRSTQDVFKKIRELYQAGNHYVLECDIVKFFDSVDLESLLEKQVFPALPDTSINHLLRQALNQEKGNLNQLSLEEIKLFEATNGGVPQGNALSPLLSNIYLYPFDERMLQENLGLVRYADDFVVLVKSPVAALKAFEIAKEVLEGELKLKIYPLAKESEPTTSKTSKILSPGNHKFVFLSIRFDGKEIYPSDSSVEKLIEKMEDVCLIDKKNPQNVMTTLRRLQLTLDGWLSSFYFTNIDKYLNLIDDHLDRSLHKYLISVQWKMDDVEKRNIRTVRGKLKTLKTITKAQRKNSGIPLAKEILDSLRIKALIRNELKVKKSKEKALHTA